MDEIEYVTIPKRHWLRTSDALDETTRERDTFKRNLRNALIHAKAWKAATRGIWRDREKCYERIAELEAQVAGQIGLRLGAKGDATRLETECAQFQEEVRWQAERAGRAEAELAKADAKWGREWSAQRERAEKAEAEVARLTKISEHERRLGKAFDEIHEILGTADLSEAVEMVRTLKEQRDFAVVRAKFLEGVERLYHKARAELATLREQS